MTNHAEEAKRLLQEVNEDVEPLKNRSDIPIELMTLWNGNAMRELAVAQVQATLALVEQQRIANIIALSVPQELPGGSTIWRPTFVTRVNDDGGTVTSPLPEIIEALGLEEEA